MIPKTRFQPRQQPPAAAHDIIIRTYRILRTIKKSESGFFPGFSRNLSGFYNPTLKPTSAQIIITVWKNQTMTRQTIPNNCCEAAISKLWLAAELQHFTANAGIYYSRTSLLFFSIHDKQSFRTRIITIPHFFILARAAPF